MSMTPHEAALYDAQRDLHRIIRAASRLADQLGAMGRLIDSDEEIPHIAANLDHVRALLDKEVR